MLRFFRWYWVKLVDAFVAMDECTQKWEGQKAKYKIVPHEETDWGTMFAIVDAEGNVVGLDLYIPAKQRCAVLNSARRG